jgi:hypothetical protein
MVFVPYYHERKRNLCSSLLFVSVRALCGDLKRGIAAQAQRALYNPVELQQNINKAILRVRTNRIRAQEPHELMQDRSVV